MNKEQYLELIAESGLATVHLRPDVRDQMLLDTCHMLLDVLREGEPYPADSLLLAQCEDYDLKTPQHLVVAMEQLPRYVN